MENALPTGHELAAYAMSGVREVTTYGLPSSGYVRCVDIITVVNGGVRVERTLLARDSAHAEAIVKSTPVVVP